MPEIVTDNLMALLTPEEVKVLLYIIRRTEGFHEPTSPISWSRFMNGIIKKDGTVQDRGTGLSRNAIEKALFGRKGNGGLVRANIIFFKSSRPYNIYGLSRQEGQPFDGSLIDWDWLEKRYLDKKEVDRKRTRKANEGLRKKIKEEKGHNTIGDEPQFRVVFDLL